jgi:hypothetical protein
MERGGVVSQLSSVGNFVPIGYRPTRQGEVFDELAGRFQKSPGLRQTNDIRLTAS